MQRQEQRAGTPSPRSLPRLDRLYRSPPLLLAAVAASVFLAEAVVMVVLSFFTELGNPVLYVVDSLMLLMLLFPALVILVFRPIDLQLAKRTRAEEELRASRERLRSLSTHLQRAREEERTAISREIHDELGQVLATVQLGVSSLAEEYRDHGNLIGKIGGMEELISGAIKTVQRISTRLRPAILDELGLAEAIDWQAAEFRKRTGIACTPEILLLETNYSRDVATAVFRIFQEALTNVMRHAGASTVEVTLAERNGRIILIVRDNGRGVTREQMRDSASLGITGMRERAYALGGRVRFCSSPRRGTAVIAHIPIDAPGGGACLTP